MPTYKDCVWATPALEDDTTMTEAEVEAAARSYDETWAEANTAAVESAKAGAEAAKGAAEATENDVAMDTEDDANPQPAQDLT